MAGKGSKHNSCRIDTSGMCHNLEVPVASDDDGDDGIREISVFVDAPPTALSQYTSVISLAPRYRVFNFAQSGTLRVRQAGTRRCIGTVAPGVGAPLYLEGGGLPCMEFCVGALEDAVEEDEASGLRRWSKAVSLAAVGETLVSVPAPGVGFVDLRVEVMPLPQLRMQAEASARCSTHRFFHL